MKVTNKNASLRHGCFTYGLSLDNYYHKLETVAAYNAKSAFIQRTAIDLVSVVRRAPFSEVICIASHIYEYEDRLRDGLERQPHIHILWYSRDYKVGTTGLLQNFFSTRKFSGKQYKHFFIKI
jgi:hypothetical protein